LISARLLPIVADVPPGEVDVTSRTAVAERCQEHAAFQYELLAHRTLREAGQEPFEDVELY